MFLFTLLLGDATWEGGGGVDGLLFFVAREARCGGGRVFGRLGARGETRPLHRLVSLIMEIMGWDERDAGIAASFSEVYGFYYISSTRRIRFGGKIVYGHVSRFSFPILLD